MTALDGMKLLVMMIPDSGIRDCPNPLATSWAGEIEQYLSELQIAVPRGEILMAFSRPRFSPAISRFIFGRTGLPSEDVADSRMSMV
ncbi:MULTISPECIES: hypothetical protein [Rhizobium]|uniref:hypothetical protein n=1 Tax=Rhizobium TaxID=379 RepID=UPI001146B286|nr:MULTISPECIES: hypothetical protein [Rhizobium]MCS0460287.1 hypothetical protein [Rhizobium favelukesii]UFS85397.1 hypothetical protein LPB79_37900 [Rhizobium sp. T136]